MLEIVRQKEGMYREIQRERETRKKEGERQREKEKIREREREREKEREKERDRESERERERKREREREKQRERNRERKREREKNTIGWAGKRIQRFFLCCTLINRHLSDTTNLVGATINTLGVGAAFFTPDTGRGPV